MEYMDLSIITTGFSNGKQLLERVANDVLQSGKPDFLFVSAGPTKHGQEYGMGYQKKYLLNKSILMKKT